MMQYNSLAHLLYVNTHRESQCVTSRRNGRCLFGTRSRQSIALRGICGKISEMTKKLLTQKGGSSAFVVLSNKGNVARVGLPRGSTPLQWVRDDFLEKTPLNDLLD